MELGDADNGRVIQIKTGEVVTLGLSENPTTGYRWSMTQLDANLLDLYGDSYQSESPYAGGAGTHTYEFRALASGTTEVALSLQRVWETTILQRYTFTLEIDPL
jgi:inhibitor of cysteine peptidase